MPKLSWLRDKTPYDVIYVKYWPKNAQILEVTLKNLKDRKTSRHRSNSKFSEVIYKAFWFLSQVDSK